MISLLTPLKTGIFKKPKPLQQAQKASLTMVLKDCSSNSLKENLRIGEDALREFKKEFPYLRSDTMLDVRLKRLKSPIPKNISEEMFFLTCAYKHYVSSSRNANCFIDFNFDSLDDYIKVFKNNIKNFKAINCKEYKILSGYSILKKGFKSRLMAMQVYNKEGFPEKNESHGFTVIGMKKDADPRNPITWGQKAVVVDFWGNLVMKADEALKYFKMHFFSKIDSDKDELIYQESPLGLRAL